MTTREFTPRLDRQISRLVSTTTTTQTGRVFTWAVELTIVTTPQAEHWRLASDRQLVLSPNPTTGGDFPSDLVPPIVVEVSFDEDLPATLTITVIDIGRHPFTGQPTMYTLDFDGDLPTSGDVLKLRIPGGQEMTVTTTEEVKIWAGRRDFSGRDFSQVVQGEIVTIRDTRYIVRVESGPWSPGDTLTDENGVTLSIQGVQQIGRQYLELLARSGGL